MDLQHLIRSNLSGKRIVLVGNAPFTTDSSALIDDHEIVIRFNLFGSSGFSDSLCGRKIHYWFVNLDCGRKNNSKAKARRAALTQQCSAVKLLLPRPEVLFASADDKRERLKDAIAFYESHGFAVIYPDAKIPCPSPKEPSIGFYTACRILKENLPITVIGFTGRVSKHHDGAAEIAHLRNHPLVNFVPMADGEAGDPR
jgi:hypothetical protein